MPKMKKRGKSKMGLCPTKTKSPRHKGIMTLKQAKAKVSR